MLSKRAAAGFESKDLFDLSEWNAIVFGGIRSDIVDSM
jgi:hypothetical protein